MKLLATVAATAVLLASTTAFAWDPCSVVIFADKTDVCVGQTVTVQTVSFNCDVPVTNSYPVVLDVPGTVTITQQCTACNGNPSSSLLDIHFSAITNLSPATATMCLGSSMDFVAESNPSNAACMPAWAIVPEDAGTLSVDGLSATFTLLAGSAGSTVTLYAYCGLTTNSAIITVTTNDPLVITSQPVSQVVCTGAVATFSIAATGDSLTYQWRKDGIDLVDGGNVYGATSRTLSITNAGSGAVNPICLTVPATSSGQSFGNVTPGVTYFYEAWGCATFDLDGNYTDPDGLVYTNFCNFYSDGPFVATSGFMCPGLTNWSLVGKINGGTCFQLGEGGSFTPSSSGTLTMYFNDDGYGDNSGSWTACVGSVDGEYDVIVSSGCGYQISTAAMLSMSTLCDGIPDWWRAEYFGGNGMATNNQSCALCDPEGDGVDNLLAYQRGTNPTNSTVINITVYADPSIGNDVYDGYSATLDDGHGPKADIQAAITTAISGDTVQIAGGLYTTNATFNLQGKSVTVRASGPATIQ